MPVCPLPPYSLNERGAGRKCLTFWAQPGIGTTSPQMMVYVGNSPPTTLFQVGELLQFTQIVGGGVLGGRFQAIVGF